MEGRKKWERTKAQEINKSIWWGVCTNVCIYLLLLSLILKKVFQHFRYGESNYLGCPYFLLMLFTFSSISITVSSVITLFLKVQICSKVIGVIREHLNITQISHLLKHSFIYEKYGVKAENSTQLNRAAQKYTQSIHTHSSNNYQLPQFTLGYELCPCTSCVTGNPPSTPS